MSLRRSCWVCLRFRRIAESGYCLSASRRGWGGTTSCDRFCGPSRPFRPCRGPSDSRDPRAQMSSLARRLADLAPLEPDDFAAKLLGARRPPNARCSRRMKSFTRTGTGRRSLAWEPSSLRKRPLQPSAAWRCACMLATPGLAPRTAVDRAMLMLEREPGDAPQRLTAAIALEESALLALPIDEPFDLWLARYMPAMSIATSGSVELRGDVARVLCTIDWRLHKDLRRSITSPAHAHGIRTRSRRIIPELLLVAATGLVMAQQRVRINIVLWGARTLCRFPSSRARRATSMRLRRALASEATHA